MAQRSPFGEFLRACRERLTPAEVGLPDSGRRRTPGLRREEVATLAGVSVDYLIRLEQGRDTKPSAAVMAALADALRLDGADRSHFFHLGHISSAPELCPNSSTDPRSVEPTVQQLLDRWGATPAFVLGPIHDVLAWNRSWEQLVEPIGLLDDRADPNLARFTFLHPGARSAYPDWDAMADELADGLRAFAPLMESKPRFSALLEELMEAPAFAERWSTNRASVKRRRTTGLVHPIVGELRITSEVLSVSEPMAQRVVVWLPADEATDDAMRRATLGGASLRAV